MKRDLSTREVGSAAANSTKIGLAFTSLVAFGALLLPVACSKETPEDDLRNCDVQALFDSSCNSGNCHNADAARGDLDLASPGVDRRLFHQESSTATCGGRTLVEPGEPSESLLYQKVTNPPCGDSMPPNGSLSDSELACLRDYIERAGTDTDVEGCETCGGILCIDFDTDSSHCGGCGDACDDGLQCAAGVCINPCSEEETLCGSSCVLVESDDENCGSCGHRCGPGTVCEAGACTCLADATTGGGGNGGTSMSGPQEVPSFKDDVTPIFESSCSGDSCHSGRKVKAPELDPDLAYGNLVDAKSEDCNEKFYVVPSNPDESYLVDKLMGGEICSGGRMPLASSKYLSDPAIETVVNWICAGAPDN